VCPPDFKCIYFFSSIWQTFSLSKCFVTPTRSCSIVRSQIVLYKDSCFFHESYSGNCETLKNLSHCLYGCSPERECCCICMYVRKFAWTYRSFYSLFFRVNQKSLIVCVLMHQLHASTYFCWLEICDVIVATWWRFTIDLLSHTFPSSQCLSFSISHFTDKSKRLRRLYYGNT